MKINLNQKVQELLKNNKWKNIKTKICTIKTTIKTSQTYQYNPRSKLLSSLQFTMKDNATLTQRIEWIEYPARYFSYFPNIHTQHPSLTDWLTDWLRFQSFLIKKQSKSKRKRKFFGIKGGRVRVTAWNIYNSCVSW